MEGMTVTTSSRPEPASSSSNGLVLRTDESGNLVSSTLETQRKRRRIRLERPTGVHLRMIRYVIIAVDVTRHMDIKPFEGGMRPSSLIVATRELARFVRMFLDANPLCRVAIHRTGHESHGSSAERVEDFSSNAAILEARLLAMGRASPPKRGGISLQNVLTLAKQSFEGVPSYAAKELLFVHSAITTRDAGDVHDCIERVRDAGIRCSVVSLSAQVRIFELAAQLTHGLFNVAEDELSLRRILESHVVPAPQVRAGDGGAEGSGGASSSSSSSTSSTAIATARFIEMGFPTFEQGMPMPKPATSRVRGTHENSFAFSTSGYTCPRCLTFVGENGLSLPCPTCGILLSASKDLARSYHHLFPVAPFEELPVLRCVELAKAGCTACAGCNRQLLPPWRAGTAGEWQGEVWLRCPRCGPSVECSSSSSSSSSSSATASDAPAIVFCDACDALIHDSLHNCPGC